MPLFDLMTDIENCYLKDSIITLAAFLLTAHLALCIMISGVSLVSLESEAIPRQFRAIAAISRQDKFSVMWATSIHSSLHGVSEVNLICLKK